MSKIPDEPTPEEIEAERQSIIQGDIDLEASKAEERAKSYT